MDEQSYRPQIVPHFDTLQQIVRQSLVYLGDPLLWGRRHVIIIAVHGARPITTRVAGGRLTVLRLLGLVVVCEL